MTAPERPPVAPTTDVLIVGMGPVGKLLAIQLGRHDHSVVIVDRNATNYPLPRAVTHCGEVARILQSIGLAPDAITGITEPFDGIYSWRNSDDSVLMEVDWSGRGETGWYNTYFFHQPDLEDAFDRILAGLPSVSTIRGWQARDLEPHSDHVTVAIQSLDTGEDVAITAKWVVGADGANSTVRGLLGVEWCDAGYFHDWLVVDVKMREGSTPFPHVAVQLCDPIRPATMVPAGPGRRRWEFMRLPHETIGELNQIKTIWNLLARHGLGPADVDVERHAVYTFRACVAAQWRADRVFLAGDAAHLMPPFAGQGLGAGLRDANNLSWKLSAVLRGAADDEILDTYGTERQHHVRAFIDFSIGLGDVVCVTDPDEAALRDRRMLGQRRDGHSLATPPRPGLGPGLHIGRHGGELARQAVIRCDPTCSAQLFDDVFGGAGALISRRTEMLAGVGPSARTALRALDIHVVALAGADDEHYLIDDVEGVYERWLDDLGADSVLVRPDFHLYGSASAGDTVVLVKGFLDVIGNARATWK